MPARRPGSPDDRIRCTPGGSPLSGGCRTRDEGRAEEEKEECDAEITDCASACDAHGSPRFRDLAVRTPLLGQHHCKAYASIENTDYLVPIHLDAAACSSRFVNSPPLVPRPPRSCVPVRPSRTPPWNELPRPLTRGSIHDALTRRPGDGWSAGRPWATGRRRRPASRPAGG